MYLPLKLGARSKELDLFQDEAQKKTGKELKREDVYLSNA